MLTSIAGRSVIVTGASKGIGKGIAKVFCQNGGKVLVVSRNLEEAEACAEELRRAGGAARGYAADVTKIGRHADAGRYRCGCSWRDRHPVRQRGYLPTGQDRGSLIGRLGSRDGDQSQGHLPRDQSLLAAPQEVGSGPHRDHLLDHGTGYRFSGLEPLRRDQGWPAWIHPYSLPRAGQVRHHRQCSVTR